MELEDFVGNYNTVRSLLSWLDDFYHGIKDSNYALLIGDSGNGKSLLPELLSKKLNVDLLRIQPFSITCKNDLSNYIKSINIKPLDYEKKLVLIDDIDDYNFRYKNGLYSIPEMSIYPVIFTSKTFNLPQELKKGAVKNRNNKWYHLLRKPISTKLIPYLQTLNNDLSLENLKQIARESKSVRSATLSLYSHTVNDFIPDKPTKWDMITHIQRRELTVPLDRKNIRWIFDSIRGPSKSGTMKNLDLVMQKFAEFEHRITVNNEIIDPFFVNNMEEPIEKVRWRYGEKKRPKKKTFTKVKEPKSNPKKVKPTVKSPLDKWMI